MIKIGIIGIGGMGTVHARNYAQLTGCRVAAVCDPSPAAKEAADQLGAAWYPDVDAMLDTPGLDVADVCTPTFLHKAHVTAALRRGLHVICEKPLALHYEDAKEMFALAREKKVQLFVWQVLQFSPATKVLRELVQSGEYGRVLDAAFLRLSACPRWVKGGWLFDKEKSGLLPFDLHIHDLDLLVSLFGAPDAMRFTSAGRDGLDYQEHYRFSYEFGKTTVSAEAAWYNGDIPFTATWRVYFEEAVAVFDGVAVTVYSFGSEPRSFNLEEKIKIETGINLPPTGMFYEELGSFLGVIRETPQALPAREEEILTVIRILETINQSV